MAGVIETITKVFAGSRYRAVSPPLPVERVIDCPGRFSFGVPWPWEEVVQDGSLVDATGQAVATQMLAFVWAPRTDGAQAVFSAWAESGQVNLDQPTLPGQLTGLYRARLIGSRRVLLGGTRAVVVQMSTHDEFLGRLVADWQDRTLHGEFRAPLAQWPNYWPHLETLLGTWSWD
jgi:hypothetical protein